MIRWVRMAGHSRDYFDGVLQKNMKPSRSITSPRPLKSRVDDISLSHDQEKKNTIDTSRENRWCERYGYFIDLTACEARAKIRRSCGLCIARWRQLSFDFMEP